MKTNNTPVISILIFIFALLFGSIYLLLADNDDNTTIHRPRIHDELNYKNDTFTFAWMSDTQYYSESHPEIFDIDVNYILRNKNRSNIKYVIHTGDIVDNMHRQSQWTNANNSLTLFDNSNMPYGVLAGNHDVNEENLDYSKYYKYYGESRFTKKPFYGGSYKNNKGHYDLISANGNDFIIVYMGHGIGDEEYSWMNKVLQENKDRKAILCFHMYINLDGELDDVGQGIYENVVLKNPNVFMVLNDHYHGVSRRVDEIDDNNDGVVDRKVYDVLADYQYGEDGGNGYIRLIKFDPKNDSIDFRTYSPKINDYNFYNNNGLERDEYGYKDEFSFPFDLK